MADDEKLEVKIIVNVIIVVQAHVLAVVILGISKTKLIGVIFILYRG